ncbi:hypothetical protein SEHO0A_01823 [Salmonella enterica subsp. houtenae str. ATCC BAA-1581]|nr:hypothetical protein SEHO0A_01823 [Salmonella enterica subsp. houtenae str. ATCC BAA-1581]
MEVARSKGRIGGRRQKLTPEQWDRARRLIGAVATEGSDYL